MTRRRRSVLALALLVAILGVGIAAWALTRADVTEGGPLAYPKGYNDALAFTVPLDTVYSWGIAALENSGSADAVVERITLVDESGTVRVVGIRAVPETEEATVGFAPGFDAGAGRDVDGLVVPPGKGNGFQLVFGLEVDSPGISGFRGLNVRYRVGDERFETTLRHAVALCAPIEQYDECPEPPPASE